MCCLVDLSHLVAVVVVVGAWLQKFISKFLKVQDAVMHLHGP